jgi:DNA-directed RNA polymerase specialized sigma24 family protein
MPSIKPALTIERPEALQSVYGLGPGAFSLGIGYKRRRAGPLLDEIECEVVQLYQESAASLLRYAVTVTGLMELAEDGVQESFLRYYVARVQGERILKAKGWLYCVLRNHLLDRLKEHELKHSISLEEIKDLPDERQDLNFSVQRSEVSRQVLRSLAPENSSACV